MPIGNFNLPKPIGRVPSIVCNPPWGPWGMGLSAPGSGGVKGRRRNWGWDKQPKVTVLDKAPTGGYKRTPRHPRQNILDESSNKAQQKPTPVLNKAQTY